MINQQPADLRLTIVSTFAEQAAFNTGELEDGVIMFVQEANTFYSLDKATNTWKAISSTTAASFLADGLSNIINAGVVVTLGSVVVPAGPDTLWKIVWSVNYETVGGPGIVFGHVENPAIPTIVSQLVETTSQANASFMYSGIAIIHGSDVSQTFDLNVRVDAPITQCLMRSPFIALEPFSVP